ncbi:MFS quinate transporter-like protein QutD [Hysterangium stoloniferum]|nr:MFS quinate transporter-like protein QutD [Hysterangium stoloniferum]
MSINKSTDAHQDDQDDTSFELPQPRQARARFSFEAMKEDLVTNRRVYLMAASAAFGGMLFGWDTGLIGGILSMDSFKHSFGLDQGQNAGELASLSGNIVSVLQAGCFFGALSSGFLSERLGRKPALLISVFIFFVGSIIQVCSGINSTSLAPLYVGRIIGGWGVGMNSAIVPAYISESSPKAIRGRMTGCGALDLGKPISLSIVGEISKKSHPGGYVNAAWRYDEATAVVARLRGLPPQHPVVKDQIDDIKGDFEGRPKLKVTEQVKLMFSGRIIFYRSILGTILMFWQQWTGTNSINYYAPQIFSQLGISGTNSGLLATGIYGCVKVVFTGIALAVAIEQAGRKKCLIYGGLGQAFAFFYIAIYQAKHTGTDIIPASYVAIVMVYLYVVFYSFGWGATPWVLAGEIPPTSTRSLSLSLAVATQWLFNFVIAKASVLQLYQIWDSEYAFDAIVLHTEITTKFLLFAVCLILMVVFVYFCMPETSGVALEHVGELFESPEGVIVQSIRDSPAGTKLLRCVGIRSKYIGSGSEPA